MKKYIYLLMMALITVSCNETDELQNSSTDTSRMLNAKITKAESRAFWEAQPLSWDGSNMVNSRTYAIPEGDGKNFYHQYWSIGDAISYFKTTKNLKYISSKVDENEDEYITHFTQSSEGEGEPLITEFNYGVYPYKEDTQINTDGTVTFTFPEEQLYCKDTYANGANGMIARHKSEDQVLEFLNFCSYLQLQLKTDDPEIAAKDIDKIVLKANDTQDFMSGVGTIAYNAKGYPEVTMDHEKSINHLVLNCRNQKINLKSEITKFWFVLPGSFTFTKGFSIIISFTDGSYFNKSTNTTIGKITIDRNHIKPLTPLTPTKNDILSSIIRYKYNTDIKPGEEPFIFTEGVDFFKDESGNPLTPTTIYNKKTGEYEITFDGHLYSIGKNTFDNSDYENLDIDYIVIDNSTAINIEKCAFWNCTADSLIIDNDIISIGEKAFGESWTTDIIINGDIHEIEKQAFNLCYDLETVTINGAIEHIEEQGFSGSSAGAVFILERVTNIGEQAFYLCTSLSSISIPMVEHIENEAFMSCTSLTKIDLHGVHKIGFSAFMGCRALKEVCISRECIEIGEGAFAGLKNLVVKIYASKPPKIIHETGQDNSYAFHTTAKIHIPEGSLDEYLKDENWKYYYDKGCLIDDITPEQIIEHFGEDAN